MLRYYPDTKEAPIRTQCARKGPRNLRAGTGVLPGCLPSILVFICVHLRHLRIMAFAFL